MFFVFDRSSFKIFLFFLANSPVANNAVIISQVYDVLLSLPVKTCGHPMTLLRYSDSTQVESPYFGMVLQYSVGGRDYGVLGVRHLQRPIALVNKGWLSRPTQVSLIAQDRTA